jgi:hypothetical protein
LQTFTAANASAGSGTRRHRRCCFLGPAARQKWPSLLLEIALILLETAGHLLKVRVMPIGKIHKLVHLSQQTYQPNSKLVPGHNDKGYGTIDDGVGPVILFVSSQHNC